MALKDENNAVFPDAYPLHMIYPGIGNNMPPFIFLIFLSHIFRYLLCVRYCVGLLKHKHTQYSPSLNVQWRNHTHTPTHTHRHTNTHTHTYTHTHIQREWETNWETKAERSRERKRQWETQRQRDTETKTCFTNSVWEKWCSKSSEARSQQVLPLLPGPLGTLALGKASYHIRSVIPLRLPSCEKPRPHREVMAKWDTSWRNREKSRSTKISEDICVKKSYFT